MRRLFRGGNLIFFANPFSSYFTYTIQYKWAKVKLYFQLFLLFFAL